MTLSHILGRTSKKITLYFLGALYLGASHSTLHRFYSCVCQRRLETKYSAFVTETVECHCVLVLPKWESKLPPTSGVHCAVLVKRSAGSFSPGLGAISSSIQKFVNFLNLRSRIKKQSLAWSCVCELYIYEGALHQRAAEEREDDVTSGWKGTGASDLLDRFPASLPGPSGLGSLTSGLPTKTK